MLRAELRGGASSLETLADFYEPRSTFGILAAFWNCFPPSFEAGVNYFRSIQLGSISGDGIVLFPINILKFGLLIKG